VVYGAEDEDGQAGDVHDHGRQQADAARTLVHENATEQEIKFVEMPYIFCTYRGRGIKSSPAVLAKPCISMAHVSLPTATSARSVSALRISRHPPTWSKNMTARGRCPCPAFF